ncbi:hypothetical protein KAFR_0A04840 [Kazachstania africana CBS 2517]|uniref:Tr-type G domain-containing protein n=1 Tax=Kazachstania africana (strain ATCC 22294 / BCRC 22015 / CBS 2517 / CECT 1963 / NBRC 1671 / NRRL Y-8276) TaxID=1071382 RepID=H2ANH0_KAZAF|nr:hypothetical protein KAFR_0A04840 [Kazachstania africana CBS 2517]CCF55920.1 hypothetical protein KAFR_0A04840 [Kazachstania africana CBS 2517]
MLRMKYVASIGHISRLHHTIQSRISQIPIENYRIFSIVAHIDHGKSTLSDRLLEITGVITKEAKNEQVLDKLEVERSRGITIKAQNCSMLYKDKFLLQLIDTPGHVDFRDEVRRAVFAVDGAILLVDASKGVQAQTVANFKMAKESTVTLIPAINKIDLPNSEVDRVEKQIIQELGFEKNEIIKISSKTGLNIQEQLLPAIIESIPSPSGNTNGPFRGLLIDSWYDSYQGVILLIRVLDGFIKEGDKIVSGQTRKKYEVKKVGIMYPNETPTGTLTTGQVGYIIPGMKNVKDALLGDTLFHLGQESKAKLLPGFKETKPMVFVGAFPADGIDHKIIEDDINRLILNDRSVELHRETSNALGQGWRLGFLGSLHATVFKERLEKEYGSRLIICQPSVPYLIKYIDDKDQLIKNPSEFPNSTSRRTTRIKTIQEPYVEVLTSIPTEYVGCVIQLIENNRGEQKELNYLNTEDQAIIKYYLPLAELVDDFFGKLKSLTRGYATLDYDDAGYKDADVVKLELLVNGKSLDALSKVVHRSQVQKVGKEWVKNFREYLRSQLYEVVIQAKYDGKVIARETIKARKKDVLAKLHASDVSRRKKLLAKQKEGKKQLKSIGNIQIPQDAYQAFLRK